MAYVPAIADTQLRRDPRTGYWAIRWTIPASESPDGVARSRAYSCRTKDRSVAEDVRQAWLTAQHKVAGPGGGTIGAICTHYRDSHLLTQGRTASQINSLKPIVRELGQLELLDLTLNRVAGYTAVRRGQGRVDGTIRRELGALRAAIGWCIKTGFLPVGTAVPYIALPPASAGRLNTLDEADEKQLFEYAAHLVYSGTPNTLGWRAALFVCIALDAPARSSAIEGLTWDRVTLPPPGSNRPGLIDYRVFGSARTKKRRVPVPISNRLLPVLRHAFTFRRGGLTPPVLVRTGTVRRSFDTLVRAAGVKHVTRHDLRRTWASLAAGRDVDLYKVAAVLGDTLATTEKNYAHLSPSFLVGAMNR